MNEYPLIKLSNIQLSFDLTRETRPESGKATYFSGNTSLAIKWQTMPKNLQLKLFYYLRDYVMLHFDGVEEVDVTEV